MKINSPPSSLYATLFLFLLSIYLLTYTPRINSSDGLAMFATAENLVRRGAVDIEQIRWLGLQQGTFGLDGLLYSRKGIGVPIGLLPLTWLGLVVPWFGPVSVSLLFNAIVTALTAVLLFAYLQQLGYNQPTGLIVALIFGLATLAWPYAKSFFSDPLAGLLLVAPALILFQFRQEFRRQMASQANRPEKHFSIPSFFTRLGSASPQKLLIYPFLAGLFLGWNVATRFAEAIFLPIYGLLLLHYLGLALDKPDSARYRLQLPHPVTNFWPPVLAFCAPIGLIGLALISFNIFRYGEPFNTGYLPNETFSGSLWDGVVGQLVSPGRGLLLYSPVLLLALGGVIPLFRRFRAEALLAISIIMIHLLLYGQWFMWHGGYAWGPRFMIPTLPFWAIFLAPLVDRAYPCKKSSEIFDHPPPELKFKTAHTSAPLNNHKVLPNRPLRLAIFVFALFSLIPQLLSVTIDFAPFQNWLLDTGLPLFARQTFFNPQYAAIFRAWTFITPEALDLAWAWNGQVNGWLLAVLIVNMAITGLFLWRLKAWPEQRQKTGNGALRGRASPILSALPLNRTLGFLPYLSTLAAVIVLLIHTHSLPPEGLQNAVTALNHAVRPTDAVIMNNPEMALPFAEFYKGRAPVLGLNHGGVPLPDDVSQRLAETISGHKQLWWLPNWLPPEESAVEQILRAEGLRVHSKNSENQRLVLFAIPPGIPLNLQPVGATFDGQIVLTEVAFVPSSEAGISYPVELHWQAMTPLAKDYHIFIHILDNRNQLISQADGQPAQWRHPTSSWSPGETVVDRHGLWIPADTAPGAYQLRVGLYEPTSGQRLYLPDGEDASQFELRIE